jgi:UDP-N-acetylmuramyl pentapeptide phosphotransferase/UDP-N-acetylglucosamine-1-phosphate transferase
MLFGFLLSLCTAFIVSFFLIKYENLYKKFSSDDDLTGVQKFHTECTPRIGGIAILAGLSVSFIIILKTTEAFWIMISILPVFFIGILEDLTRSIPPFIRLLFSFIAAFFAIYSLDIALASVGWQWFDQNVLGIEFISVLLTVVMIGGVSHSTNIIDGFNGLLLGYSEIALAVFLWVSVQVEDELLIAIILSIMGSIGGLLFFNFPRARIFTGDSGAYTIGCLLAIVSLLLVKRNESVSPWFALLVMSYPVFETLFSIYRKKFLRKMSPGLPDGIHLHMLKYKRVVPLLTTITERNYRRNAASSVLIWIFLMPFMLPALIWWDDHLVMISSITLFCFYYIWIYFSIVRFKYGLGGKKKQ